MANVSWSRPTDTSYRWILSDSPRSWGRKQSLQHLWRIVFPCFIPRSFYTWHKLANWPVGFLLLRSIKARIACISFQDQITGRNARFVIPRTFLQREGEEKSKKVDKQGGKDIRYNFDTLVESRGFGGKPSARRHGLRLDLIDSDSRGLSYEFRFGRGLVLWFKSQFGPPCCAHRASGTGAGLISNGCRERRARN